MPFLSLVSAVNKCNLWPTPSPSERGVRFSESEERVVCKSEPRQEASQSSAPSVPEKTHNRKLRNSRFAPFYAFISLKPETSFSPGNECACSIIYCLRNRFGFGTGNPPPETFSFSARSLSIPQLLCANYCLNQCSMYLCGLLFICELTYLVSMKLRQ